MRNMANAETEELRLQLEKLKLENLRLKGQASETSPDRLHITESEYHGYPTLTFQRGSKKPFSIGLKKLLAVIEGKEEVEKFLQKHGATPDPTNKKMEPDTATQERQSNESDFHIDDYLA